MALQHRYGTTNTGVAPQITDCHHKFRYDAENTAVAPQILAWQHKHRCDTSNIRMAPQHLYGATTPATHHNTGMTPQTPLRYRKYRYVTTNTGRQLHIGHSCLLLNLFQFITTQSTAVNSDPLTVQEQVAPVTTEKLLEHVNFQGYYRHVLSFCVAAMVISLGQSAY
jgi:hypothetical protein